ncbi:Uncharacterised protein [Vibrio cholerae]|uniref:Uncharacterized protein n=1 Tax=Vibrio cholerae TaxID=666 RepID=A0A655WV03_VIBCL|nr:Uncharacterised protein [Vibrio cholerae]CSB99226.1 Uncharacterised protein [Vibrio cholerae]CSC40176.1 Uncharacterised protein [Vibrio cholerae]
MGIRPLYSVIFPVCTEFYLPDFQLALLVQALFCCVTCAVGLNQLRWLSIRCDCRSRYVSECVGNRPRRSGILSHNLLCTLVARVWPRACASSAFYPNPPRKKCPAFFDEKGAIHAGFRCRDWRDRWALLSELLVRWTQQQLTQKNDHPDPFSLQQFWVSQTALFHGTNGVSGDRSGCAAKAKRRSSGNPKADLSVFCVR